MKPYLENSLDAWFVDFTRFPPPPCIFLYFFRSLSTLQYPGPLPNSFVDPTKHALLPLARSLLNALLDH